MYASLLGHFYSNAEFKKNSEILCHTLYLPEINFYDMKYTCNMKNKKIPHCQNSSKIQLIKQAESIHNTYT